MSLRLPSFPEKNVIEFRVSSSNRLCLVNIKKRLFQSFPTLLVSLFSLCSMREHVCAHSYEKVKGDPKQIISLNNFWLTLHYLNILAT